MPTKKIQLTKLDHERLTELTDSMKDLSKNDREYLDKLRGELQRAKIITSKRVKPDVITMNSTIKLRDLDDGECYEYQLVYPNDADPENNKLSILAPIGTALLGFRIGDVVEWPVPAGVRHLKIEEILYQPEAAGDYTL